MFLEHLFNQPIYKAKKFVNQTLDWFPSDTEESWLYHLHEKKDKSVLDIKTLEFFKKNPVEYRLNNFGYRTDYQFKQGDKVNLFIGCSYTFGVGVNFEDTWVYKIGQDYDLPIANVGVGGSSINTAYRQLYFFKDYFNIENIFHYQPLYCRFEYFVDKKVKSFIIDHDPLKGHPILGKEYMDKVVLNEASITYNHQVHLDAIENVARTINANYYYLEGVKLVDFGRDLGHYGPKTHTALANLFRKQIAAGSNVKIENKEQKIRKALGQSLI